MDHPSQSAPQRSIIIPVLDFSPHSPYNIRTLLDELTSQAGEVICIFNSPRVFAELKDHPRIDKYCFNKQNAGVPRSWNQGIDLAEGRSWFILNADLHLEPGCLDRLEEYLFSLEDAAVVGPQGSILDFKQLKVVRYFQKGRFHQPVQTHDVSGFLFALHAERCAAAGIRFDNRYSPCQMEEWDLGLQVLQAGLRCYAVPVGGFEHHWGVSNRPPETELEYFGRKVRLGEVLRDNRAKFRRKWRHLLEEL